MNRTASRFPYFIAPVSVFRCPISSQARFVYLALAARASRNEQNWPSLTSIVSDTNLSIRNVTRALQELEEARLLVIHSRRRSVDGPRLLYTLYPPEEQGLATDSTHLVAQSSPITAEPELAVTVSTPSEEERVPISEETATSPLVESAPVVAESASLEEESVPISEETATSPLVESAPVVTESASLEEESIPISEETSTSPLVESAPVAGESNVPVVPSESSSVMEMDASIPEDPFLEDSEPQPVAISDAEAADLLVEAYRGAFGRTPPKALAEDWADLPYDYVQAQLDYCSQVAGRAHIKSLAKFVRAALENDYAGRNAGPVSLFEADLEKEREAAEKAIRAEAPPEIALAHLEAMRDALRTAKNAGSVTRRRKRRDPWGPLREPK